MRKIKYLSLVIIGILLCSFLGQMINTNFFQVQVKEISYMTEDGAMLSSLLYIPKNISVDNPAPAIIAIHGYNNTRELQAINAIELSRRGFIVMAIDSYGHGYSTFPDKQIVDGIVIDMGAYSAMQYLGTLPYVDKKRIGLVGHSLGSTALQAAARRAFNNAQTDLKIVTPTALLLTANSFDVDTEGKLSLEQYPVNLGNIYGQFDEWAQGMWGVSRGSDIMDTPKALAAMGFEGAEFNNYYSVSNNIVLSREKAIEKALEKTLRVMYQPATTHPRIHFSSVASSYVVDFFTITLMQGESFLTSNQQIWIWKEIFNGIALLLFFVFIVFLGLILLDTTYFKSIKEKEYPSFSFIDDKKSLVQYIVLFLIGAIPAPFIYNWAMGYPIDIKSMGRTVQTVLVANNYFQMPVVNGLVVFNLVSGVVALAFYLLVYNTLVKKRGASISSMGICIPYKQILKSLLLAVIVFLSAYALLEFCYTFFLNDFRFYTNSIKPLTSIKFLMFLKYLPFFAFAFIINSMLVNTFTAINNISEWKNILLIIVASVGGLFVLYTLDYSFLFTTGIKAFPTVPYPAGTTSALAGVLLWGLLFILPISAVISRIFFKATGSIWLGAWINTLLVTLFAISSTVVSQGIL